jgi:hypothetical protein
MTNIVNALNGRLNASRPETANDQEGNDKSKDTTKPKETLASKFDPARIRVSQQFGEITPSKKILTTVQVAKPHRQQWVRVHPSQDFRLDVAIIEDKDAGSTSYLVEGVLVPELIAEVRLVTLFTATTRAGDVFLWKVPLPDSDGRQNLWSESGREAASAAMKNWVRVVSNMPMGRYEHYVATGNLGEPNFPDYAFSQLLEIAFKGDRYIDTMEHSLVARLRGAK